MWRKFIQWCWLRLHEWTFWVPKAWEVYGCQLVVNFGENFVCWDRKYSNPVWCAESDVRTDWRSKNVWTLERSQAWVTRTTRRECKPRCETLLWQRWVTLTVSCIKAWIRGMWWNRGCVQSTFSCLDSSCQRFGLCCRAERSWGKSKKRWSGNHRRR